MTTNIDKKKSIVRSKKSLISLGEIFVATGAATLGPKGAIGYKIAKRGIQHVLEYISDRKEERLAKFHELVLNDIPDGKQQEFLNKPFSKEDYYNLLNRVVQDEEDDKVEIYAKLFQGIVLDAIPKKYKLHLIKTTKNLSRSDLELMRTLYTREIKGTSVLRTFLSEKQSTSNFNETYSFQTLLRLGFLAPSSDDATPYLTTDLLKFTVEFFFDIDIERITPVYRKPLRVFLAYDKGTTDSNTLLRILNALQNEGINTVCACPVRTSLPLLLAPIIAICVQKQGNLIDSIRKFVPIESKEIIQVVLPGGVLDDLPFPNRDYFDLRSHFQVELKRLINHVKDKSKLSRKSLEAYQQKTGEYKSLL